MKNILELRQTLHDNAELSGNEKNTNLIINNFLNNLNYHKIIRNIGGYGIAVLFKGKNNGKRIMVRADIDGLNIKEGDRSFSHRCGHDGHTAILCGLAERFSKTPPERGEILLLFQPAEETGQGAEAVINDPNMKGIMPDMAFALHNLPGYKENSIVTIKGCFAAASLGLKISLDGITAHASQPETGINPTTALYQLLNFYNDKSLYIKDLMPYSLITVTHAVLGEKTFGIAPGKAEIWVTLRSFDDKCLDNLKNECIEKAQNISQNYSLHCSYSIHEYFPSTKNHDMAENIVEHAAKILNLNIINKEEPFKWSEDFGRFSSLCPTAMFGLGCGEQHLPLHNPDYCFNDNIIKTGIDLFEKTARLSL